jgi:LysR family transcriptional activator of nhaA
MAALNFKHLRYFWAVARAGSIARAGEQLHLTPQSISTQLRELEEHLGVDLFRRAGRGLEVTDAGRRVLSYADEIFTLGDELVEAMHDQSTRKSLRFTIGIADSVPKMLAYRLIEPALSLGEPLRLVCREGRLTALLAELSVHRLDLVIADRPMPGKLNVRGYSHLLGESDLTICASPRLAGGASAPFPQLIDGAPFLLPGEDVAIRSRLEHWFEARRLHPRIVGEFDDSALLKAFGKAGAGYFATPTAIAPQVCTQYGVVALGRIEAITEALYAISTERRLTHPAVLAISKAARRQFLGHDADAAGSQAAGGGTGETAARPGKRARTRARVTAPHAAG